MRGPWTDAEIRLLGTKPDFEVGRLIGRPGKAVWAKRRSLGIAATPLMRPWLPTEDEVIRSNSVAAAAKMLNRAEVAVRIRRRKLGLRQKPAPDPKLLSFEQAQRKIEVSR